MKKFKEFKIQTEVYKKDESMANAINEFIEENNVEILDFKYNTFMLEPGDSTLYVYVLVMYRELPPVGTKKINGRLIKPNNKGDE